MSDQVVQVQPDSTGKKIDTSELTVGANTVERQRIVVAGVTAAQLADVLNAAPSTEYGLVTRNIPSGTQPVSAASLPLPAGAATAALQTQPSVDIGDVTVNNGNGAAAVPIQDGGNSVTVDNAGTFAVQDSEKLVDNAAFTDGTTKVQPMGCVFDEVAGTALTENDIAAARIDSKRSLVGVLEDATTRGQRAAVSAAGRLSVDASGVAVPITDNAGSLTVDAPVGTPVAVRQSDGAAFISPVLAAQLPAALVGGRVDENVGAWLGSTVPTVGQKAMASCLPVALASDQTVIPVNGDVDHDAVNTLKNIQIAGHASPSDVPPAVVSANADRVRAWMDRSGALIVRPRRIRESYTAVFRLAQAAGSLDQTFTQVANTNKHWATLHHAATATKEVRLMKCFAYISVWTVATQGVLELRQLSAAPATGNPAITPTPHRRGGTAAEAVALYLPTTQGTDAGVDQPLGMQFFDYGIIGAVSTINPIPHINPIVLYDAGLSDDEEMPPVLPVGVLDGWAVMLRTVGAPAVRMTVVMRFTEEIP